MLTLRVLTLTDAEKEEMRNGDPRARHILERTEWLTIEVDDEGPRSYPQFCATFETAHMNR